MLAGSWNNCLPLDHSSPDQGIGRVGTDGPAYSAGDVGEPEAGVAPLSAAVAFNFSNPALLVTSITMRTSRGESGGPFCFTSIPVGLSRVNLQLPVPGETLAAKALVSMQGSGFLVVAPHTVWSELRRKNCVHLLRLASAGCQNPWSMH